MIELEKNNQQLFALTSVIAAVGHILLSTSVVDASTDIRITIYVIVMYALGMVVVITDNSLLLRLSKKSIIWLGIFLPYALIILAFKNDVGRVLYYEIAEQRNLREKVIDLRFSKNQPRLGEKLYVEGISYKVLYLVQRAFRKPRLVVEQIVEEN